MNRTFKVIKRETKFGLQAQKRVYTSYEDYLKYGEETFERYSEYWIAEAYELIGDKWIKLKSAEPRKKPYW